MAFSFLQNLQDTTHPNRKDTQNITRGLPHKNQNNHTNAGHKTSRKYPR